MERNQNEYTNQMSGCGFHCEYTSWDWNYCYAHVYFFQILPAQHPPNPYSVAFLFSNHYKFDNYALKKKDIEWCTKITRMYSKAYSKLLIIQDEFMAENYDKYQNGSMRRNKRRFSTLNFESETIESITIIIEKLSPLNCIEHRRNVRKTCNVCAEIKNKKAGLFIGHYSQLSQFWWFSVLIIHKWFKVAVMKNLSRTSHFHTNVCCFFFVPLMTFACILRTLHN